MYVIHCSLCSLCQGAASGGVSGTQGEHSRQEGRFCLPQRISEIPKTVSPLHCGICLIGFRTENYFWEWDNKLCKDEVSTGDVGVCPSMKYVYVDFLRMPKADEAVPATRYFLMCSINFCGGRRKNPSTPRPHMKPCYLSRETN